MLKYLKNNLFDSSFIKLKTKFVVFQETKISKQALIIKKEIKINIKNNNKLFICKLKKFKKLFIISCDRELLISRK